MEDFVPLRPDRSKLEEAIMMVSQAVNIAYEADDESRVPTDMDLTLMGRLCETLWSHYFVANHILRGMCKRVGTGETKRP
jgi:hypothetical protein